MNQVYLPSNTVFDIQLALNKLVKLIGKGGGSIAPLPHVIYVDIAYTGGSSDGSIAKPFVTIQDAINSIPGVPTRLQRYAIIVAPGYYPDPIALRPWAFIVGMDAFLTRITTSNITLPTNLWNPASLDSDETDVRSGFHGLIITQAHIFDFNVGPNLPSPENGSKEGKLYFTDVISSGMLTFIAYHAINQTQHRHCQLFGGLTQQGMQVQFEVSSIVGGTALNISNQNGPTVVQAIFNAFGGATNGTINLASDGAAPSTAQMQGFAVAGQLNISGAQASYNSTPDGIPSNIVLVGGAPPPVLLSRLYLPTMTNAQRVAITSPSLGLMVYCTDIAPSAGLWIYKAAGWTFIA